jgi:hypothetical protein
MLAKAVDYSFYVTQHGDYEFNGRCFGIDDEPEERLLITDCGGYLNVLTSTVTLGLLRSSEEISSIYRIAAVEYLDSIYTDCEIYNVRDYGGRLFEIHYDC